MKKRLGYVGILVSYGVLLFTFVYFCFIKKNSGGLLALCLVGGITLLFASLWLASTRYAVAPKESLLDEWLRKLCFFPALLFICAPCFFISAIMIIFDFIVHNFRKKVKALCKKGFSYSKSKDGGQTVYRLQKGDCIVKIIPEYCYQISFDGGEKFENIADSVLGTKEEREELKRVILQRSTCDYREKDLYDVTRKHIQFLAKNI